MIIVTHEERSSQLRLQRKGVKRLTDSVVQKCLRLSFTLSSTEASFVVYVVWRLRRGKDRKRAGDDGKGKERKRGSAQAFYRLVKF